jgi:hypothetical protein
MRRASDIESEGSAGARRRLESLSNHNHAYRKGDPWIPEALECGKVLYELPVT